MNFVTLTNKYDRKVVIRIETIMSIEDVIAPHANKTEEKYAYILYGEVGVAPSRDVYVKESVDEILKKIETPYAGEIDRDDTYPGLWDLCEKLANEEIGPTVAVAVIQSFIENEITLAVERARAMDSAIHGTPEQMDVDPKEPRPGLLKLCQGLAAHDISPERGAALMEFAIRKIMSEEMGETEEEQMERDESEMIDRKMAEERARKQDSEGV